MITEFQDGFITKTKLNELVGGINLNSGDIVEIKTKSDNIIVLTGDVTKTVGTGGDFATLNLAIDWCKKVISNGYKITLQLVAGFIMAEQIVLENVNLGFVRITGIDDETSITESSLILYESAFYGYNSTLPSIAQKFVLDKTGVNKIGLLLTNNSKCIIEENYTLRNGFNNSSGTSISVLKNSELSAMYLGCNSSLVGVEADGCSRIDIRESEINCNYAVNSYRGSHINAVASSITASTYSFRVTEGGVIVANNSTGNILSQTANTITASGIIFK